VQIRVGGAKHLAHAARSQRLDDHVAPEARSPRHPLAAIARIGRRGEGRFREEAAQPIVLLQQRLDPFVQFRLPLAHAIQERLPLFRTEIENFSEQLLRRSLPVVHRIRPS